MTDNDFTFQSEEWFRTKDLCLTGFNERPTDGIAWYEGYSDPYLVINLEAQLRSFEVASDEGNGYKGEVIPGDFSFVPPGMTLGGRYAGSRMRYVSITFPAQRLNPCFTDKTPIIMRNDPVVKTFAEVLVSKRDYRSPDEILYRESITEALVQHLKLVHLKPNRPLITQQSSLDRLDSYIRSNIDRKITVAELSRIMNLSSQTLQHKVREAFDQSVYERVTTLRLEKSLELLRTTKLDLASIAITTGFSKQSHWTRLFKHKFSTTPGKVERP